ncbi:MAG: hypothetical protein U0354_08820 [Candidatus Sericytochromatia bacterium]
MKKIICLLISALIMSCSQVNMPITQESKSTPRPVQSQTVVANNQNKTDAKVLVETKPEIKSPTTPAPVSTLDPTNYNSSAIDKNLTPAPTPTPTVIPVPSTNFIQVVPSYTPSPYESGVSEPFSVLPSYSPNQLPPLNQPLNNPYYFEKPTPEGNEGDFYLLFKDEYKIRYNETKKEFYSLLGYDTKSINEILINKNIRVRVVNTIFTEEEMDEMEQVRQASESGDVSHLGSRYRIETQNISNIEIVNKMRANPYVRQFNYEGNQYNRIGTVG